MKNWVRGILMAVLVLGLAACSDEPADVKPGTEESKESELTIQEVFEKAQEASEQQESMHALMDIDQNIESASEGFSMDSKIKMDMDMVLEPFAMYQVMDMEILDDGSMELGEEGSMTMEMYLTEEGFFMKDPESDAWMKLPEELYDELTESMTAGADPTLDMDSLEQFVEDFTFEQNDDEYILKLKASGDKFKELIQSELDATGLMEGMNAEEAEVFESMEIHQLDYEIFIDKETFNTTAFNMIMDMEMGVEDDKIRIVQDVKADISKINEIEEIKVPQEVLDAVVEQ